MHKNALLLIKNCKNRPAMGGFKKLQPPPPQLRNPGYATVAKTQSLLNFKVSRWKYVFSMLQRI